MVTVRSALTEAAPVTGSDGCLFFTANSEIMALSLRPSVQSSPSTAGLTAMGIPLRHHG